MPKQLIPPSKKLGYTDLYLDFVNGQVKGKSLYLADTIESVAHALDALEYDRSALVDILTEQNKLYQVGPKTHENISRLNDPRSVCVFAGQQAGLFGGPMFTLIKAIAVIKSAARYEKELNRPVIPVFWIAGDDHDFEEANHTSLLNHAGEVCLASYATPPPVEMPVARIKLSDEEMLYQAKAVLRDCCGETEFTKELYDLLDRSYTTGDSFVTAFGKFVSGLLGDLGLVLFCPTDDKAKRLAVPFFKRILSLQNEIHQAVTESNEALTRLEFHIQVEKKETASHLFYELDGRQPVLRDGDQFTVGETRFSKEELESRIEEHPERFSPDVMTRPIFQSFLFPVVAQKGGPSEIAYLAQINKLFRLFGLAPPLYQARPTATVVEARHEKLMADLSISFDELFGDIEQVINRVMATTFPSDLEHKFEELSDSVEDHFKQFIRDSLEFDDSLKQVARQIYGRIDYNLKNFEHKVFAAHKRKSSETRDRIYRLYHALCPNRGFQERTVNVSYFISRHGFGFVRFLYDQLEPDETSHQLISLSEMTEGRRRR